MNGVRTLAGVITLALTAGSVASAQPAGTVRVHTGLPTTTPGMVACLDRSVHAPPDITHHIVASYHTEPRHQFAVGDLVVLSGSLADGLAEGQRYFIRRLQPTASRRPPSERHPGAVRTAGWLTVVGADDTSAIARVDYSCDAALIGDYLEPYVVPSMDEPQRAAGSPRFEAPAMVMFGVDQRENFGSGDLFTIDHGAVDGVLPGGRFVIYRDRLNGTPLLEIGEGQVVAVEEESARVLLTRARDAVRRGDFVMMRTPENER